MLAPILTDAVYEKLEEIHKEGISIMLVERTFFERWVSATVATSLKTAESILKEKYTTSKKQ